MERPLQELIEQMALNQDLRATLRCCIGFDGYVDEIYQVLQKRVSPSQYEVFQTISEFGDRVTKAAGMSADMEIIPQDVRMGGNSPLLAHCLASQGVPTVCMGAMGYPEIRVPFMALSPLCETISIGEPCHTFAFEFTDGKLMFGNLSNARNSEWSDIKRIVGMEKLLGILAESHLIGLMNWSAHPAVDCILEGILEEILPQLPVDILKQKRFFFDIADPSSRSQKDLTCFLELVSLLQEKTQVTLGLNLNEAHQLYRWLVNDTCIPELSEVGSELFQRMNVSTLVIHALDCAIGVEAGQTCRVEGFFVKNPAITTGGGDNFNGGFCLGQMMGFPLNQALLLGNVLSSFYVRKGYSPSYTESMKFIDWLSHSEEME